MENIIAIYEKEYFTGCFSEKVIRDDLENRKTMDMLSTMGSNPYQTYCLPEKKNFYIKEFNTAKKTINTFLNSIRTQQPLNSMLISRCEKCIDQANRLINIVENF